MAGGNMKGLGDMVPQFYPRHNSLLFYTTAVCIACCDTYVA